MLSYMAAGFIWVSFLKYKQFKNNTIMKRISKKDVLGRLKYMSKVVGEEYDADYAAHYGGWNMYLAGTGGTRRGVLGFDARKSTTEFMEYMNGVINAAALLENRY